MIALSQETEALAVRLAAAQSLPVEAVVRRALEDRARAEVLDLEGQPRRRMSAEQMLRFGSEIVALPLIDQRPPDEIMEDLNAQ